MPLKRPLDINEILHSADAHRETTGSWPTTQSGVVLDMTGETWAQIDRALREGRRGLPDGSSLPRLLTAKRQARNHQQLPALTEEQILAWADAHYQSKGKWPKGKSGHVKGGDGETWSAIDFALRTGTRGLSGGSSLAQFLAAHRGVRHLHTRPRMTEEQILAWADDHHARTMAWPTKYSGPVVAALSETWEAVHQALYKGRRGLPGGSSLAQLLADKRPTDNVHSRPRLSVEQILAWGDAHYQRVGQWPHGKSGPVLESPGETWGALNVALHAGSRGLPGGSSLAQLRSEHRGVRNAKALPAFHVKQILAWANTHHKRTGQWPSKDSGSIAEAPEETWIHVDDALRGGGRGLRGGSSLAQLLAQHGKKRNRKGLPPLSRRKIVAWATAHHERTGKWPNCESGPVTDAPGEGWAAIDAALRTGCRGFPGGSSLRELLFKKGCGVPDPSGRPPLSPEKILQWADLHFQRADAWPKYHSGPIVDAPEETWSGVDAALRQGKRSLPGQSSLAKLLAEKRIQRGCPREGHCSPCPAQGSETAE